MCFGGSKPQPAATPAPAPPPPAPIADEQEIAAGRVAEDKALFGSEQPTTRVDRSLGVGAGGTGIRM